MTESPITFLCQDRDLTIENLPKSARINLTMNQYFIYLVTIVAFLEVIGDILFKEWSIHSKNYLLILGILAYMAATLFWAFSLKYQSLSKAMVIFAVLTLIVGILVGVLFYKEDLSTLNIVGIALGLGSIVLLEI